MQNSKLQFKIKTFYFLGLIFTSLFLILPLITEAATLYLLPQSQT
ncbi:unnamed protein product, partial [marine sediment metagenome]